MVGDGWSVVCGVWFAVDGDGRGSGDVAVVGIVGGWWIMNSG